MRVPSGDITRRSFLRQSTGLAFALGTGGLGKAADFAIVRGRNTDVRVERVSFDFDEYQYRVPMKFAGTIMDRATLLTVHCTVRSRTGKEATGFGSMPFNHTFSYPSKVMSGEAKNEAMKALAAEIAQITGSFTEFAHPLEVNRALAPSYLKAAAEVSARQRLADPVPALCTLVTASAFDAAVHDAFGKLHGVSCFQTYGPEFMTQDLSAYAGPTYRGKYPSDYLLSVPKPHLPLCHLISAIDPLEALDNTKPTNDQLPETLVEWIHYNGLTEFKIKLNGDDLTWDLERVLHIDRVIGETEKRRGVESYSYVLDFNEKCTGIDYFMQFLRQLKEQMPAGFRRIRYVEQPTARDLRAHPENRMHEAAKLCPVVIDESLTDLDSLRVAREMGWTGAVVKSPKGLSNMLVIASAAMEEGMLLAGGDMSCPGAALIQTAGFQARIPSIASIEANARQYLPQANRAWEERFPGMFRIKDGAMQTSALTGAGLGA